MLGFYFSCFLFFLFKIKYLCILYIESTVRECTHRHAHIIKKRFFISINTAQSLFFSLSFLFFIVTSCTPLFIYDIYTCDIRIIYNLRILIYCLVPHDNMICIIPTMHKYIYIIFTYYIITSYDNVLFLLLLFPIEERNPIIMG